MSTVKTTKAEDRITKTMNKHKAFFAFNNQQFEEGKTEGIFKYVSMGAGLICPKENVKQLIEDMHNASKNNINDDLKANGKKKIIHRELANHEASYTYSIEQTVDALEGYGITREEVQAEFGEYIDNHIKWEEVQERKAEAEIKHRLNIISLHDAQAKCKCGWNFTGTGERTEEYIQEIYKQHLN